MSRRFYVLRAFGWQLDYRPDGWLPLGIRQELGVRWHGPKWHILRLGPLGCITLGRLTPLKDREVTVTITANTQPLQDAMRRQSLAFERIRWQMTIVRERTAARRWWLEQMTEAYGRYGWDWPGPIRTTAGELVACDETAASCRCTMPAGHVEAGDPVHACDPAECSGQWTGTYDESRFDGGSGWEPVASPRARRRPAVALMRAMAP